MGCDVSVASTVQETRDALRSGSADLLVLDLQANGVPWEDVVAARSRLIEEFPALVEQVRGRPG